MIILHHGTSTSFLPGISARGLRPDPPVKMSIGDEGSDHPDVALDGVYGAANRETAEWYASKAAERFGGDPMVIAMRLDEGVLVPDEDEIHYSSTYPLAVAAGHEPDGLPTLRKSWSIDLAVETIAMLAEDLGCTTCDRKRAASALHGMIGSISPEAWRSGPGILRPVPGTWAGPAWRKEVVAARGVEFYRRGMDDLCRAFVGADPQRFACGLEGYKARCVDAVSTGGSMGIVGMGTLEDPFAHYDGSAHIDGSEMGWDLDALIRRPPCP